MGIKNKFDFENETLFSKFLSIKGLIEALSNDENMSYSEVATFMFRRLGQTESPPQFYSIDPIRGAVMSAKPSMQWDLMKQVIDSGEFEKLHNKYGWAVDEMREFLREIEVIPSPIFPAWEQENDGSEVLQSIAPSEAISKVDTKMEKPLATTERTSLLTIIAALCDYSDIKHQERGASSKIVNMVEEIGAKISHDTVLRALEKIPEALESRTK